jgi:hypothetical protein
MGHTGRARRRERGRRLLGSEGLGNRSRLYRRQRSARLGNRRVLRRLRTSLGLFAVTINVILLVQAESAELNSGTIDLVTVARHANGLLLVKDAAGVGGSASRCAIGGLGSGRSKATARGAGSLMLLLRRGVGGRSSAGGLGPRIPRVGGFARSGLGLWGVRIIGDLFEIRFGKLILGGLQGDFGNNGDGGESRLDRDDRKGGDGGRRRRRRRSSFLLGRLGRRFLDGRWDFGLSSFGLSLNLRLNRGRLGDRWERLDNGLSRLGRSNLLWLRGRLRHGLSQHASPGLLCGLNGLRGNGSRRGGRSLGGRRALLGPSAGLFGGLGSTPYVGLVCGNRKLLALRGLVAVDCRIEGLAAATAPTTSLGGPATSTSALYAAASSRSRGSREGIDGSGCESIGLRLGLGHLLGLGNLAPLRDGSFSDAGDGEGLVTVCLVQSK